MENILNVENFEEWLKNNLNNNNFELNQFLEDLIKQYGESDLAKYELSKDLTISGNTEYYLYKVEFSKIDDNNFETKFIL